MTVEFDSAAIEKPGSEILYSAASGLERALADTAAAELLAIKAELIWENWEPELVQAKNLPFLAWALGVTLWREGWPELKRRGWVRDQWVFKSKRGTEAAIRMALGVMSEPDKAIALKRLLVPPQWPYASRTLTKAELDAWLSLMPQLRTYLGSEVGSGVGLYFTGRGAVSTYASAAFADHGFARFDEGEGLYGRKARVHFPDGVEVPVRLITLLKTSEELPAVEIERVSVPGRGTRNFANANAFADNCFADSERLAARVYTYKLDRTYSHDRSTLSVQAIEPSLDPVEPRYMRVSEVGDADSALFCGQFVSPRKFIRWDKAPWLMFDRIFLHDPAVAAPRVRAMSFADHARLGMAAFSAELMIQVQGKMPQAAAVTDGRAFVGGTFAVDEDHTREADAVESVLRAKALRDKTLVTFQTTRAREWGEGLPLDGSVRWGDRVPATL